MLPRGQAEAEPNAPDACVWGMAWKNPHADKRVTGLTVSATGTEATLALLGVTAVYWTRPTATGVRKHRTSRQRHDIVTRTSGVFLPVYTAAASLRRL